MVAAQIYLLAVISCIHWTFGNFGQPNSGPVGHVEIASMSLCQDEADKPFKVKVDFHGGDDDSFIDASFDLDQPITPAFKFKFVADKFEDGTWQEEAMKVDAALLNFFEQNFQTVWDHAKQALEIYNPQEIGPGKFETKGFHEKSVNIDLPSILYGQFKINFKIFDGDDACVLCLNAEGESIPP